MNSPRDPSHVRSVHEPEGAMQASHSIRTARSKAAGSSRTDEDGYTPLPLHVKDLHVYLQLLSLASSFKKPHCLRRRRINWCAQWRSFEQHAAWRMGTSPQRQSLHEKCCLPTCVDNIAREPGHRDSADSKLPSTHCGVMPSLTLPRHYTWSKSFFETRRPSPLSAAFTPVADHASTVVKEKEAQMDWARLKEVSRLAREAAGLHRSSRSRR